MTKPTEDDVKQAVNDVVSTFRITLRDALVTEANRLGVTLARAIVAAPNAASRPGVPPKRRSSATIQALMTKIIEYVGAHPGTLAVEMSTAFGCASRDIRQSLFALVRAKRLRIEGRKKGTRYFAVTPA